MNLKEKLYRSGWDYIDINPLTGNEIYGDADKNQIEILHEETKEDD